MKLGFIKKPLRQLQTFVSGVRWLRVFTKRIIRRFINALQFKEMWTWKYESCDKCGTCYRIPTGWVDELWLEINGRSGGCLCLECVIKIAQKKKNKINLNDIKRMWIFDPDGDIGGCVDIIKPTGKHHR